MNKVYVVLYNGNVSSDGYSTEEKAIEFIETRTGNPEKIYGLGWIWIDDENNEYKIREVNIR